MRLTKKPAARDCTRASTAQAQAQTQAASNRPIPRITLHGQNWDGRQFNGYHFDGFDFVDCNLSECTFTACRFTNCRFYECCFVDSIFHDCHFEDSFALLSDVMGAKLQNCHMSGIPLPHCNIHRLFKKKLIQPKSYVKIKTCFAKIEGMSDKNPRNLRLSKGH